MKVLLLNGSPHKEGCTYTALNEVSKTLNDEGIETEIYWIGTKPIAGCTACATCKKTGKCIFDDKVEEFKELAKEADGFIFGTPVYYANASGQIRSFLDRLFYSTIDDTFYLKPGAAVASARRAGTTATLDEINKYFTIKEMPIISSQYWNMVHGFTPEDVKQDREGLQIMRTLARNMAFFLKCKKIALENDIELPKKEEQIWTNFIR